MEVLKSLVNRFAIPVVILFALSAGGVAMCGLPGDTLRQGEGISGVYIVNGFDPVGIEYSGTVKITATDTIDEYVVEWIVTGGVFTGTGTLNGDRFVVDWESVTDARGEISGTAEYTLDADGVLTGTRTIDGVADVGTEEIFPDA